MENTSLYRYRCCESVGGKLTEGDPEDSRIITLGDTHVKAVLVQALHLGRVHTALDAHLQEHLGIINTSPSVD
jgi:hypothetical protein